MDITIVIRSYNRAHNNAGILKAQLDNSDHSRSLMGVPLFIFPQLLRSIWRYLAQMVTDGANFSFRKRMNLAYFVGMVQSYRSKATEQS